MRSPAGPCTRPLDLVRHSSLAFLAPKKTPVFLHPGAPVGCDCAASTTCNLALRDACCCGERGLPSPTRARGRPAQPVHCARRSSPPISPAQEAPKQPVATVQCTLTRRRPYLLSIHVVGHWAAVRIVLLATASQVHQHRQPCTRRPLYSVLWSVPSSASSPGHLHLRDHVAAASLLEREYLKTDAHVCGTL